MRDGEPQRIGKTGLVETSEHQEDRRRGRSPAVDGKSMSVVNGRQAVARYARASVRCDTIQSIFASLNTPFVANVDATRIPHGAA